MGMVDFMRLTSKQKLLIVIAPLVSLFTWWQGVDPVNLPKMVILGFSVIFLAPGILINQRKLLSGDFKIPLLIVFIFILSLLIPFVFSSAPRVQQFYGVSARHTGLLTSALLAIVALGFFSLNKYTVFKYFTFGLLISGSVNAFLSIFQVINKELLPFNNIYGTILGTFGNPNFVAAFLGLSCAVSFSYLFAQPTKIFSVLINVSYLSLCLFLIIESNAKQGLIVYFVMGFGSLAIKLLYTQKKLFIKLLLFTTGLAGLVLAGFGSLGHGPLGNLLYKTSVGLRGQYWNAGIEMFKSHPFTGVGLNSYGDWYREFRDAKVLDLSGIDTVTNASHNVYIDYAATGGIVLLASYVSLNAYVLFAIIRCQIRVGRFDPVFSSLVLAWLGYQVQSLVSIDQIGLSVWGWALAGAIIGFYKSLSASKNFEEYISYGSDKKMLLIRENKLYLSRILTLITSIVLVPVVSAPLQRDVEWARTLEKATVQGVITASKKFPIDESRMIQAASILANNGFSKESLDLSIEATKFKERSYFAWRFIYENSNSTSNQKAAAKARITGLDPLSSSQDK